MSKIIKSKNLRDWSKKNLLETPELMNSSAFCSYVSCTYNKIYYCKSDNNFINKFSVLGDKTLQYVLKTDKKWLTKFLFKNNNLRQNFLSKPQKLNKDEEKLFRDFIIKFNDKKEILYCLEQDINSYVKKQIRFLKEHHVFTPGMLLIWNNSNDLFLWKENNFDIIVKSIQNNHSGFFQLKNNNFIKIKNKTTMYVVKEHIVLCEDNNKLSWKRLVQVVVSLETKAVAAVMCFDAFNSKKSIVNNNFIKILQKPNMKKNNNNFIFPRSLESNDFIFYANDEKINVFLCDKEENYNTWKNEVER